MLACRYVDRKSGRKYGTDARTILPREEDPIKAESAKIFYEIWQLAKTDPDYVAMLDRHRHR